MIIVTIPVYAIINVYSYTYSKWFSHSCMQKLLSVASERKSEHISSVTAAISAPSTSLTSIVVSVVETSCFFVNCYSNTGL